MSRKRYTNQQLAEQLRAQGIVILQLREDSARRDRLAIANSIAKTMREDTGAQVKLTDRVVGDALAVSDADVGRYYGEKVREPSLSERMDQQQAELQKIHEELREHGSAISELNHDREPTNPVEVEGNVVRDTIAASCHLIADVIERNGVKGIGKVDPTHLQNLRRAASILRDEDIF